ncbi:MAG: hypothetical protein WCY09_09565 [Candidatus Omnitrophota bacterium]
MPSNAIIDAINMNSRSVTRVDMVAYGEKFTLAPLTQDELELFKAQFADLMSMVGSDERKIMLARVEQYILGLRAIKSSLNGTLFTGVNAGDTELGMSLIRPQFTRNNAIANLAAYRANWNQTLVANTWTDWIFDGAGQPMLLGRDFGWVVTHLKSLTAPVPFFSEIRFVVGRTGIMLPADVRALQMADTENNVSIIPLPTMYSIPKASFYARAKADSGGIDNVPLGGILFGLGRALREEIPTWLP